MPSAVRVRPAGVTGMACFFMVGAAISAVSLLALAMPGKFLEPIWRLNPRAREAFAEMEPWGLVLMAVVLVACLAAATGLLRRRHWGWVVAATMLGVSLAGDLANALSGLEPRAWFGVPIAAALLAYLMTSGVRRHFAPEPRG